MKQFLLRFILGCAVVSLATMTTALAQAPCGNVSSGGPAQPPGGGDDGDDDCPNPPCCDGNGGSSPGMPGLPGIPGGSGSAPPGRGGGGSRALNQDVGGVNVFKAYTANAYRRVHDLELWGGVGEHRLVWKRAYTSRTVGSSKYFFGFQCNWRHSYTLRGHGMRFSIEAKRGHP
jgi:hypothetical protein